MDTSNNDVDLGAEVEQRPPVPKEMIVCFDEYQCERVDFVKSVSDLVSDPKAIPLLYGGGIIPLLKALLMDSTSPMLQNSAAMSLGKIASYSAEYAQAICHNDLLSQLVYLMQEQSKHFKKSASYLIRSIAKKSPDLAQQVIDAGAGEVFVHFLEEFDTGIKEAGAWGLCYIVRHSADLAQHILDYGAITPLVLCAQEPEVSLKRIVICTLVEIAKHTPPLAQAIVDADTLDVVASLIHQRDIQLKRQILALYAQVAKHGKEFADFVIERTKLFPDVIKQFEIPDSYISCNAATCLMSIARHSQRHGSIIVTNEGIAPLVKCLDDSKLNAEYPAIRALGYLSSFAESIASIVIEKGALPSLVSILETHWNSTVRGQAAWCIGMIGRHSSQVCKDVVDQGALQILFDNFISSKDTNLSKICKDALKALIPQCAIPFYLQPIMTEKTPPKMMELILKQLALVLPPNADERLKFIKSPKFQFIQALLSDPTATPSSQQYIHSINASFPKEAVKFYTPGYEANMLKNL